MQNCELLLGKLIRTTERDDARLKMKIAKDKASLFYNDFLTLNGIPPEVFDCKLGNRSALEWVIDQYRVTKDDNGNIASDPNRLDDEQRIARLIIVSLETVKAVKGLSAVVGGGMDGKS